MHIKTMHGYELLFDLIDIPLDTRYATLIKRSSQSLEESPRQIDRAIVTPYTLVNNLTSLGNTIVGNSHRLPAIGVCDDALGQREHELSRTMVRGTAEARIGSCGGSIVVCDITGAGRSLRASAVVVRAGLGDGAGNRGIS